MNEEMNEIWQAMKATKYNSTVNEIKDSFYQFGDLNDLIQKGLRIIIDAMHAEVGTLWFYDYYGNSRIVPMASSNEMDLSNISLALGEGIAGSVIENGKAIMVSDCQKDERWANKVDAKTKFTTKSMICTPLLAPNSKKAFGCLQFINKTDGSLFDNADLEFAGSLAKEYANEFTKKYTGRIIGFETNSKKYIPDIEKALSQSSVEKMMECAEKSILECGYTPSEAKKMLHYLNKIYNMLHM